MSSHLLGMLEPASILQVNRHTGRAPGVTPDRRQKPRVPRSFPDRSPGIVPVQRAPAKRVASLVHALKQRLLVLNWQWCEDWYDATEQYRVLRGASWFNGGRDDLLASFRTLSIPGRRLDSGGFRCVVGAESSR
jgi:hypothetical protein